MAQRENHDVLYPSIEILKSFGFSAFHLSPSQYPGFPDIDAKKDSNYLMIEVKDFTGLSDNLSIKSQFTKYQIPWLIQNYKKVQNIYILAKFGSLYYHKKVDKQVIEILAYKKLIDIVFYFNQAHELKESIYAIINNI